MEELTLDNILDSDIAEHLFDDDFKLPTEEKKETGEEPDDKTEKEDTTEEITGDDVFSPESVGSEDVEEQKDTVDNDSDGSSPSNFYSSIARAAKEDGILADLDDETIDKIASPEDFGKALESQVQSMLNDKQKRIDAAITAGLSNSEIQTYERTLDYLDSLSEAKVKEEGEAGDTLRKQLIYQDFINRGFSKERAKREVEKSYNAGTEVDDAITALQSNKDFYTDKYNELIEAGEAERQNAIKQRENDINRLRKEILDGADIFEGLKLDKATRQKVFDSIMKPAYKDKETGDVLTEVQKYERDNHEEFLKKIGLLYVMTDKFTKLDNLIGKQVNKEVKKGLRSLERTLNNTQRDSEGNLRLITGRGDDKNSYSGIELDI